MTSNPLAACCFALVLSCCLSAVSSGAEIAPIKADATKHLALDPRLFAEIRCAQLRMGSVEKDPANPLFQADKPWENSLNNLYPNVAFDEKERVLKLWYKCVLNDKEVIAKMMPPSTIHDLGWFLLYATSSDGRTWVKPELGLIPFDGSTKNNIVARDTPNVGVTLDPHDPDPARRYKMLYDVGSGKMRVRFSADGLRWSEPLEPTGFTPYTGDTHNNAFWDEGRKKYLAITRFYLAERLVARSESDDFLKWDPPQLVLRSTLDEGKARQLYCMPAFAYGSGYLGFVMPYNVGKVRTVDCELAWSPDSKEWRRVLPGVPFIPRGAADSYDGGCIYAQAGPPVMREGKMLIIYGGSKAVHQGWKRHCLPCAVTLRPDGFAALEPKGEEPAMLISRGLRATNRPLTISANAKAGKIRVAVVDEPGYDLEACEPISADVSDAEIRWRGGKSLAALAGKSIRLQVELVGAQLYSLAGVELVDTKLPRESIAKQERPVKMESASISFDRDAENWKGVERATHYTQGGVAGGYLSLERSNGDPIAIADDLASNGVLGGNWPERFGGSGLTMSFQARSAGKPQRMLVEIFAKDISQWSFTLPAPTADWQKRSVEVRYDWTDEEAKAAGWRPAIPAFSWRETMSHVGRVVIISTFAEKPASFDLDEIRLQTIPK